MVPQRQSTKSASVEQLSLLPLRKPCPPPDLDYLKALPSDRRALRYAVSLADLEPKQVYDPLDMDKATWSRIENGGMGFPLNRLKAFRDVVQNDALLLWLNHDHGYDIHRMVRIKNDVELRLENAEARIRELEREREIERAFVQDVLSTRK